MPYRELNFDRHNLVLAMSEVKNLFQMHFEQGCRYMAKHFYEKVLAVVSMRRIAYPPHPPDDPGLGGRRSLSSEYPSGPSAS